MKARPAERGIFERWYILTNKERIEQGFPAQGYKMAERLGISRVTLNKWSRKCRLNGVYPPKTVKKWKKPSSLPEEMQSQVDSNEQIFERTGFWNDERTQIVNEAILESARHGNANAQKLAKQLAGELVEKKEVKFVISADDYFRIRREAESRIRELIGDRDRDRGVQPESTLLLSEDGLSPEQEHPQDSEMAVVAVSA